MRNLKYIADCHYNQGNYAKALSLYRYILQKSPADAAVLQAAGGCCLELNQFSEAVVFYKALVKKNPSAANLVLLAAACYHDGRYEPAEKYLTRALQKDGDNYPGLVTFGNLCFMRKDYARAFSFYRRAEKIAPAAPTVLINLAKTCFEQRDYRRAEKYALKARRLDSRSETILTLLGNISLEREDFAAAAAYFKSALKLKPGDGWLHNYLSRACQGEQIYDKALYHAWKALELSGGEDSQQLNFAYLLYEILPSAPADSFKRYLCKWQKKYAGNPIVDYALRAVNNSAETGRADPDYVRKIFDNFADGFEEVLASLNYKVPQYVDAFLQEFYPRPSWLGIRILDAGCGTGLCAPSLKKYARFRSLDGVDLSEKMLRTAAGKKLYNRLFCADLAEFVTRGKAAYHLIVAADVLTYFGDLKNLFSGFCSTLKEHGRIIFSVTKNTHDKNDYFLHASGRFQHSKKYLKSVLEKSGFRIEKIIEKKLRNEGGKSVCGFIVSAVRT